MRSMADIILSTLLAILTIVMAYVGVHVTLHPPNESPKKQLLYKLGFFACGVLAVILVIVQGVRGLNSQRNATNEIDALQFDIRGARAEAESAKQEVKSESSRRQKAERDLALIIENSGRATRRGVAEDIRKSPLRVEVTGQPLQDNREKRRIREGLGALMQRGMVLRDRCSTGVPVEQLTREGEQWFEEVQRYLNDNLDSSYLDQFLLTHPDPLTPGSVRQEMLPLWHGLNQRTQTLSRFIDQLK
jgi:hypothetical protein